MMLAKLIATLAISIAPAATRSAAMSALAPRSRRLLIGSGLRPPSVLCGGGAHHLQHVVHRRLVLGGLVADRVEQRLHFGEVVGGEPVHVAAEARPVALELLVEVEFPLLGLGL